MVAVTHRLSHPLIPAADTGHTVQDIADVNQLIQMLSVLRRARMWEASGFPRMSVGSCGEGGAVQDGTQIEPRCPMQVHEFRHNILAKSTGSRAGSKGCRLLGSTIPRTNVGGF